MLNLHGMIVIEQWSDIRRPLLNPAVAAASLTVLRGFLGIKYHGAGRSENNCLIIYIHCL